MGKRREGTSAQASLAPASPEVRPAMESRLCSTLLFSSTWCTPGYQMVHSMSPLTSDMSMVTSSVMEAATVNSPHWRGKEGCGNHPFVTKL